MDVKDVQNNANGKNVHCQDKNKKVGEPTFSEIALVVFVWLCAE